MYTRNFRTLDAGQEDCEFKVTLTYITRSCQEKKRKHIVKTRQCQAWWVHVSNSSTWEAKAEGSGVRGHPQLYSEFEISLGSMRTCLQTNNKRG